MIARLRQATRVSCVGCVALALFASGCKKKPKPFPPAPQLSSTATTQGAAFGPDGGGSQKIPTMAASSLPAPADTMTPPDRAAFEEAKAAVADLDALVKRGVLIDPDKPDDPDGSMRCASLEPSLPRLDALVDPDVKKVVADEKRLCSLEIPVISADKTLKQVTISPSQASRQLMCKYASKDIETARAYSKTDRRVRDLDARFMKACR